MVNNSDYNSNEAEDIEIEDIETVEPEESEQEFFSANPGRTSGESAAEKTEIMKLDNQRSNLELDLEIRKREAEFRLLVKKTTLVGMFLIFILSLSLVFIKLVPNLFVSTAPDMQVGRAGVDVGIGNPPNSPAGDNQLRESGPTSPPVDELVSLYADAPQEREVGEVSPSVDELVSFYAEAPQGKEVGKSSSEPRQEAQPETAPAPQLPNAMSEVDEMLLRMLEASNTPPFMNTEKQPEPVSFPPTNVMPENAFTEELTAEVPLELDRPSLERPAAKDLPRVTSYTVKWGDTFFDLALASGLSVDRLAAINEMAPPFSIRVGQVLLLHAPNNPASPVASEVSTPLGDKDIEPSVEASYKIFAQGPASVWVIDSKSEDVVEVKVGLSLGPCGKILSVDKNLSEVLTENCPVIRGK